MHLKSLTIKNFRVLQDVHVENLGHVNLIVGKNNSGKSTVLEAVSLLAGGFQTASVMSVAMNRDDIKRVARDERRMETRVAFENFFTNRQYPTNDNEKIFIGDNDYNLSIEHIYYQEEEIVEKHEDTMLSKLEQRIIPKSEVQELIEYESYKISTGLEIKISGRKSKIIDLEEDENLSYRKINFPSGLFNHSFVSSHVTSIEELARAWDELVFTEAEEHVIKILKIIQPDIENLAFLSDGYIHYRFDRPRLPRSEDLRVPYLKIKDTNGRIPLHSMGDGVLKLLQIILKIFSAKDGLLLIDEFENGLHYSVQADVWRHIFDLAKEFNIQVFATTHSWDCIESFAEVAKESELDGVLFRLGRSVRKSDNGKVIATEFDEDELYNMTKMQMEVR